MFTVPFHRDTILTASLSDASTLNKSRAMAELMHQMRDPAHTLGGSVGSIPQTLVANSSGSGNEFTLQKALSGNGLQTTPATNLKLAEAVRNAPHDASPNIVSSKMKSSKSYTHGLSNSAGTVNIPTSTSAQGNLSLLADISPNHTHFFEVMYVGKIRVSNKRVPFSFIDDALPKFKAYDAQRSRLQMQMATNRKMSLNSETTLGSIDYKTSSFKEDDVEEEDEDNEEAEENSDANEESKTKKINHTVPAETEPRTAVEPIGEFNQGDDGADQTEIELIRRRRRTPKPLLRGQSQELISLKE